MGDRHRRTSGQWIGALLVVLLGAATVTAAAQTRFPEGLRLVPPAFRTDAPLPLVPERALAAGDREYDTVMRLRADAMGPDAAVRERATTDMSAARLRAVTYYLRDATTPALLALAHSRMGDIFDVLATVMTEQPIEPDPELALRLRRAPPETRDEVLAQITERLQAGLAPVLQELWCEAYGHYHDAVSSRPPDPRAAAQLRAYGPELARVCGRHGY